MAGQDNPTEANWLKAADILKDRIEGRFLKPAQALIDAGEDDASTRFGFAILALDFLVIETVQGFREGLTNHDKNSTRLFKNFLLQWDQFQASVAGRGDKEKEDKALELYIQGRCALHHSGTTDKLIVGRRGDMLKFNGDGTIQVNRTEFHKLLTHEFNRYMAGLRNPTSVDLRANLKNKMDAICRN
ncbi:hypothetical protein BMJ20_33535 [Sinorhizobium medicae]|uniref:hypothetical protein n=1 Tax=Sinorhizobium medicae TaxID=110321 RepID=UPI000C7DBE81|nr:hypothetical protein [Sinorhizobium medicae]PLU21097.1 hypothetical protein BMJ31_17525 [Sinorhizobium medicae]PLU30768.1 hypothetical protein BMJ28_23765 [Sinorhizobium medicae]PLU58048.1 hypothetical protein BMJ24_17165 [Sinorhizobium medicae]PLU65101.1 hypothetical protein BMJ20_33535 [Sinorhizobium medicae]